MKRRCGIWVAVSTQAQFEKASPEHQRAEAEACIDRINGVVAAEFVVPGESRSIANFTEARRSLPAYQQLYDSVRSKQIDTLVYYDDSRLGRTAALVADVRRFCLTHGVSLYNMSSPPNSLEAADQTRDQGGRISSAVLAVLSEIEIEKLKERWRYGNKRRIQDGKLALGQIPYGYLRQFTPEGEETYVVVEDEATVVARIFHEYVMGDASGRHIADGLNRDGIPAPGGGEWGEHSVRGIVHRAQKYAGYSIMNLYGERLVYPGIHPAIIDEDLARQAAIIMAERSTGPRRTRLYRYSRCLICGHCGSTMSTVTRGKNATIQYYRCINKECEYWTSTRDDVVHEVIKDAVQSLMRRVNMTKITDSIPITEDRYQRELETAGKQLAAIITEERELARQLVAKRITDEMYDAIAAETTAKRSKIEEKIREIEKLIRGIDSQEKRIQRLYEAKSVGLSILNHPDVMVTNAWCKRTLRVTCWDEKAWEEMALPSRFRVDFI